MTLGSSASSFTKKHYQYGKGPNRFENKNKFCSKFLLVVARVSLSCKKGEGHANKTPWHKRRKIISTYFSALKHSLKLKIASKYSSAHRFVAK